MTKTVIAQDTAWLTSRVGGRPAQRVQDLGSNRGGGEGTHPSRLTGQTNRARGFFGQRTRPPEAGGSRPGEAGPGR